MKYIYLLAAVMLLPVVSYAEEKQEDDVIVFTAPPRGSVVKETSTYQPIADFLSEVIGKKVVYKQPVSWMHYQKDMWSNNLQIAFDGPHFVSWRLNNKNHTPLVKLPQPHVWVVIARKDDKTTNKLVDLQGRAFCGHPPPNFGTLTIRSKFESATREFRLVVRKGWKNIYNAIVDEQVCYAGVLPITNLNQYDPDRKFVKVIYTHEPYANQALTMNTQFSLEMRQKVKAALLSEKGQAAMENLRKRFTKGQQLVEAHDEEYRYVSDVLKNVYGYGFNFNSTE
ncbi:MAG: phosphate/phosphite/phosphonate ABC transporter substrate-binding protein [Gammaproteobacteria bacterium]|nr:phosphate/phosphite/phosphonate ABC transporter substrate-binding protein [Gammaproteobacteria bacterium]MDH5652796.1 phosphate/phosphite/phosphonate ABC transporter substrate-binding protein [Gammaproteobacteria bacterium]